MQRPWVRIAKALAAAIVIAVSPGLGLLESVEHGRASDQPTHPHGAHFEGAGTRSHSDHCFAGRTFGYDRLVPSALPCKTSLPAETAAEAAPVVVAGLGDDPGVNRSRAPPPLQT